MAERSEEGGAYERLTGEEESTGASSSNTGETQHHWSTSSVEEIKGSIESTLEQTDWTQIKEKADNYAESAANYAQGAYKYVEEHTPSAEDVLPDEQAQTVRAAMSRMRSKIARANSRANSVLHTLIHSYGLHEALLGIGIVVLSLLSVFNIFQMPSPLLISSAGWFAKAFAVPQVIWCILAAVCILTSRKAPIIATIYCLSTLLNSCIPLNTLYTNLLSLLLLSYFHVCACFLFLSLLISSMRNREREREGVYMCAVFMLWYLVYAVLAKAGLRALIHLAVSAFFGVLCLSFHRKRTNPSGNLYQDSNV